MINKIKSLLEQKDTKPLVVLLCMGFLLSFIEVVGIAAIMPFISMAANPDIILENQYLNSIYNFFNFKDEKNFIFYFGIALILFYIFRAIYTVTYTYLINKFTYMKYKSIVNIIFQNNINLPYIKFVKKNSSAMLKVLISEAYQISALTLNTLNLLSEVLVISILYILLLLVDVKMTLVLTILLGIKVLLLSKTISSRIKVKSSQRAEIEKSYYKIIGENLANFKLIKFASEQKKIFNKFLNISTEFSKIHIYHNTIQILPRVVLEAFGLSLLMAAVLYVLLTSDDTTLLISTISMYALALYRILPAITKILNSYNNIMFHSKSLDIVYEEVNNKSQLENDNYIKFDNNIEVKNINFSYDSSNNILNNVSFNIKKGQKIAFIGQSGSGKSTLVDMVCGIYRPSSGSILIDGVELDNSNIVSWRKRMGYIPQSIYLFDGSISENIVFGREYNEEKLIQVLKQSNVYEFIMKKEGLDTIVGEGGIQLSGGQIQRIGIARALYGNPETLVLDEATSALDTDTEKAIMDEIYKVSEDKTLMIIAHRLSTIERCDIKIDLDRINKND